MELAACMPSNGSHLCAAGSLLSDIASVSQLVGQDDFLKVGRIAAHLKKVTAKLEEGILPE